MRKSAKSGAALAVVLLSTAVVATIAASMIALVNTQRQLNLRKELQLQANTVAEAAVDYAYSCLVNDIDIRTLASSSVPSTGSAAFTLPTEAVAFLTSALPTPAGLDAWPSPITISIPEVRVLAPRSAVRYFVDPRDPASANDPNINNWVIERAIPIVAKVQVSAGETTCTAYVEKRIALRDVPLFQHAIFFSGQLQLHRGYRPVGDVHANGPLLINGNSGDQAQYSGFVSSASRMYRGSTMGDDVGGSGADAYGYTKLTLAGDLDFAGGVNPVATNPDGLLIYKERDGTTDIYASLPLNFDSRLSDWKEAAIARFNGHLADAAHQKPALVPTGSDGYRLDVASTTGTNEFTNGPYSLIEPLLPPGHAARKPAAANRMNLEANCSLILRVECIDLADPDLVLLDANGATIPRTLVEGTTTETYTSADLKVASNISDAFRVKAYKWSGGPAPGAESPPTLLPVTLPPGVVGAANAAISSIDTARPLAFEPYAYDPVYNPANPSYSGNSNAWKVASGLHDSRLGRGVDLLTIDVAALKAVMEADPASLSGDAKTFRDEFSISHASAPALGAEWNGGIYVEFPTSLDIDTSAAANTKNGIATYKFQYGPAETRHPDRVADSDSRAARTDGIVPIAPQLRRYPPSSGGYGDTVLANRFYAIPAVQLINAKQLPDPHRSPGFTLATNAPLYLLGSYNSDGDYSTATNVTATAADAYAGTDTGEVMSAIFSDTFTVLSEHWIPAKGNNRERSFPGYQGASESCRHVPRSGTTCIEIGACIATGEFPIFEFFFHALEGFEDFRTGVNAIVVKGSTAGILHSEIQHIKQAYGRDPTRDIQVYCRGHGFYALTSVRYTWNLMDGLSAPLVPCASVTTMIGFRLLRPGDPDDRTFLQSAGFL
jgi:hypothetical protein